jgi:hypothetical protein
MKRRSERERTKGVPSPAAADKNSNVPAKRGKIQDLVEKDETIERKQSETNAEALKADGKDDGDWRRPLFYWKGSVSYVDETFTFKGSWVADLASNGVPQTSEYEATKYSSNFSLTSNILLQNSSEKANDDLASDYLNGMNGMKGSFEGSYLLDQGDGNGASEYQDLSHNFLLDPAISRFGEKDVIFVSACGKTEFGNFVSGGYAYKTSVSNDDNTSPSETIECILARRYITNTDERQKVVRSKDLERMLETYRLESVGDSDGFFGRILPRKCARPRKKS